MKKQIIKKETLIKAALLCAVIVMAPDLMAAAGNTVNGSIEDQTGNLVGDVKGVGSLFRWIVALVGGFFAFSGIMGLKKYADDPRSNPINAPLIKTLCGGLALGFGVFTEILSGTVVDSGNENQDVFEAQDN